MVARGRGRQFTSPLLRSSTGTASSSGTLTLNGVPPAEARRAGCGAGGSVGCCSGGEKRAGRETGAEPIRSGLSGLPYTEGGG